MEKNGGAAGIDGMKTEQLGPHLAKHWLTIRSKLLEGTYAPSPVKRVWIAKANGGERPLGIPTVLDRFVQQLVLGELQPLYEPTFSQHSWGFRPGRGAHDAVRSAQRILTEEGKSWIVDMDIKGFFDTIDHELLLRALRQGAVSACVGIWRNAISGRVKVSVQAARSILVSIPRSASATLVLSVCHPSTFRMLI